MQNFEPILPISKLHFFL